ncbi:MAG: prolyl oligopeptidase family serine peptidase [Planctomycetaceae bacterium]|jgi:predicted peptidase|nr:prolyl oligopeptidase family serine peptidase [Planctomycetaceae bacterium]
MPPAGRGSPLHPCRLPASSRRSLSDGKSFHREVEGNCGEAASFPASAVYYDYLLHLPRGYHDFRERPLIVFLHGAGETGQDVTILKRLDIFHYADGVVPVKDFPFIVVSPVTPQHGWDSERVIAFLEEFLKENRLRYQIDTSRIYLTGFSMGGFGTFHVASDYPDYFAAIVPLAGGGESEKAENLLTVPTWAFHGDADDVVNYEMTSRMIDAMRALNHPNVHLTTLHDAGHGIPDLVYTKPELYRWLLKQKKESFHSGSKHPL